MITNEHLYQDFDLFMRKVELKLKEQIVFFYKVENSVLNKRISQKIMQLILYPYSIAFCNKIYHNQSIFGYNKDLFFGGLRVNRHFKPFVTFNLFFHSIGLFSLSIFLQIFSLFKILFTRSSGKSEKFVLMFDSGSLDLSDVNQLAEFQLYCEKGPIELFKNKIIVVKSSSNFCSRSIRSSKNPFIEVLKDKTISNKDLLNLIFETLYTFFEVLVLSFKEPLISIIATDFVNFPVVRLINRKEFVDDFLITTSSIFSQPLWMRNFNDKHILTHFINYSNNSLNFVYKDSPIFCNFPALRHISVDVQWVWNKNHEKMYRLLGHTGSIHIVGPILFYLQKDNNNFNSGDVSICLFDVTPAGADVITNLGLPKYYYTIETVTNFVEMVLEVCNRIESIIGHPIKIHLKHKRQFTSGFHATLYQKNISRLLDKYQNFTLVPYKVNLYDLISNCVATVSIPYTSTAFVSASIGVPAIYFDSTNELLIPFDADECVEYIYVQSELEKRLYSLIVKNIDSRISHF